jgi:predicted MFS family arabinose efflux permease
MLGQALGWRATFWAVVAIGVLAAAALARWVPDLATDRTVRLAQEFRTLRRPQVLLAMLISALSSVSLFSVFTYITPLLEQVSGFTPHGVSVALLLFGVGLTVGNMVGGRLADWRLMPAAIGCLVALVAVLVLFGQTQHSAGPALATLVLWGAIVFALVSPLQMRVLDQAVEAPNMASILNQGAFNFGNACGAWLGAAVPLPRRRPWDAPCCRWCWSSGTERRLPARSEIQEASGRPGRAPPEPAKGQGSSDLLAQERRPKSAASDLPVCARAMLTGSRLTSGL